MDQSSFKKEKVSDRFIIAVSSAVLTVVFGWRMFSTESDHGDAWLGWLVLTVLLATSTVVLFWRAIGWWRRLRKEAELQPPPSLSERIKKERTPAYKQGGKNPSIK